MSDHDHLRVAEEKITALAKLGRGTSPHELLKIIRFAVYTPPAELALTLGILDGMSAQVRELAKKEKGLLARSKLIIEEAKKAA
jgi:hypothetical protein